MRDISDISGVKQATLEVEIEKPLTRVHKFVEVLDACVPRIRESNHVDDAFFARF